MLEQSDSGGDVLPSAGDLFRGSDEGILVHDATDGRVVAANPAAERLYGQPAPALRDTQPDDFLVDTQTGQADVTALADTEETVEWRLDRAADEHRVLKVRARRSQSSDTVVSFARAVSGLARQSIQNPFARLQQIVSRRELTFDEKVDQLLELGRDWLGLSVGYMTRIDRGRQTVDAAVGDHAEIQAGETAPLTETYCQHTLSAAEDDAPIHSIESAADVGLHGSEEYDRFDLSCYLGGVITVDDTDYGTVCFADTQPSQRPFSDIERTFVDLLTQWLGLSIERQHQSDRLRAEHELTDAIFESSPTGILVWSPEDDVTLANDRANELLGDGRSLAGADTIPVTLADDDGPLDDAAMPHRRVADGETLSNEQYRLSDTRYVSISGRALGSGQRGVVLTIEDVTEQRRQTDAMRALSDTLASATGSFEDKLEALLDTGRKQLRLANGHLTEIDDGRHEIVASQGLTQLLPVGDVSVLESTFCQSVVEHDGMCTVTEASADRADLTPHEETGLETYVGTTVTVDGALYGTICFVDESPRDRQFHQWEQTFVETLGRWVETQIRQRRDAERRDRDRALLEGVFDSQRTQVGIVDTDGTVVDANDAAVEFVGLDRESIAGTPVWETPWFDTDPARTQCRDSIDRALDGEMTDFENEYEDEDGETAVFSVNVRPVVEDGEVINVVIEGHDITALRQRERELQRRQQHIDTILENVPLVLFAVDETGEFLDLRGRGLTSFGLEQEELVGKSIYDEYSEFPDIIDDYERACGGEAVESVRTLGETTVRSWYRQVDIDGETHVIGITIDITEQQRQKERVASVNEAAEQLMYARTPSEVAATLVDIVGELIPYPLAGVWMPDETGDTLLPIAATDRTIEVMDAGSVEEALPDIEPGSMEMSVFEDGTPRVIEEYETTDGELGTGTPIETVVMIPLGDYGVLHVGSPTPKAPTETELDLIGILARNAEAALASTTREVELEAYKDELERSNQALQEFAYIASHDLQEPLRMVSSYVDLLENEYADQLDEEASEYMTFAIDGARRMQNMIDALLQYSRVETQGNEFERVESGRVVEQTLDALQLRIDETDATVSVGELPTVQADPDQLGQLFQNLLENAIEYATQDDVVPHIEVTATRDREMVTVTVADNGPGIPDAMTTDVFEIFNRGSSHDTDGTGIGLAVCRRIVRRHDGEIWVEQDDSPGAIFRFTLPVPTEVRGDD